MLFRSRYGGGTVIPGWPGAPRERGDGDVETSSGDMWGDLGRAVALRLVAASPIPEEEAAAVLRAIIADVDRVAAFWGANR